jgi:hypothetical protein
VRAGDLVGELLATLSDDQRAALCLAWDSPERGRWTYFPGVRSGLALRDMQESQQDTALSLLRTALSEQGVASAHDVMALESVLRTLEQRAGVPSSSVRHPLHYWFAVFGDPTGDRPWGWRVAGHHLDVHVTVVDDDQVVLPLFLGANPATAPDGTRVLAAAEDFGRALLMSLDQAQRRRAVVSGAAPDDILTGNATRAELAAVPVGIGHDDLDGAQRARLAALVDWYTGRPQPAVRVDLHEATFAWLGSLEPSEPHYYAVRAGNLFVELDKVQDGANHVHTVLRDVRRDWGEDLLAEHYRGRHA